MHLRRRLSAGISTFQVVQHEAGKDPQFKQLTRSLTPCIVRSDESEKQPVISLALL